MHLFQSPLTGLSTSTGPSPVSTDGYVISPPCRRRRGVYVQWDLLLSVPPSMAGTVALLRTSIRAAQHVLREFAACMDIESFCGYVGACDVTTRTGIDARAPTKLASTFDGS